MKKTYILIQITIIFFKVSCSASNDTQSPIDLISSVTFLELGSDRCITCREMRPIMDSIQNRYGKEQINVIFIDLLKEPSATKTYKVRVMPTQIFLDNNGAEFQRHEGFYSEETIDSLLQAHGLNPII